MRSPLRKEPVHIDWDVNAAEKGGFEHFMLKEMYEQPKAIADTFSPRIKDGKIVIEELGMSDEDILAVKKLMIVACGSAYHHTGVTSKYIFEDWPGSRWKWMLRLNFRYRDPYFGGRNPGSRHQSVRRDGGHSGSAQGIQREGRAGSRHCECGGKLHCPGGGQCDVYPGRGRRLRLQPQKHILHS